MLHVCVGIGSNLGDREANLRFAVDKIRESEGKVRVSSLFESEAWGYHSDNPFYNIVAEFDTDKDAYALLDFLQTVEKEAGSGSHRDKEGGYVDRVLDIDIIFIGGEVMESGRLIVPHPKMAEREFVLVPLAELSPGWVHPLSGLTVVEMLRLLKCHIGH
ncbi:MAG TPA: 2-amino-4-hydroxy-6-hydroxymethyldihydropteridine diphosphokinase [Candidatus Limisoma gallistercoris]|nr:2-amino-4-hydroxy-6-hydroxymethyldihydropteridine diphosphokinase [Candidatus Limisoma gallistercoris]